jgi:Toprim domain/Beta-lactamase
MSDPLRAMIGSDVRPDFAAVRTAFEENFTKRAELGGACCVYRDGEKVVDLWGGIRDATTGAPWEEDTMVIVYSLTKGMSAMTLALAHSRGWLDFDRPVAEEACRFLNLPRSDSLPPNASSTPGHRTGSSTAAQRLLAISRPISGTLVETYLRSRGIAHLHGLRSLSFHPRCYTRSGPDGANHARPAMIAAVTDLAGVVTGLQRTWLDPSGARKAQIATPRRAMGDLLGHAVRFGLATVLLGVGEGIETTLSIREALPGLPVAAALSAAHLAAVRFPPALRRLYILQDNDPAGEAAARALTGRAQSAGIDAIVLTPRLGDFNDDLRAFGAESLRTHLRVQIAPEDVARLLQVRPEHAGME